MMRTLLTSVSVLVASMDLLGYGRPHGWDIPWNVSQGHRVRGEDGKAAWHLCIEQIFHTQRGSCQAGNLCVDISFPLPTTLVTSVLPEPPVRFTTVSLLMVWGLINIFPSGSL